ncbi:chorismate mutase [Angulomicrobium tetraedrale]|uniref:chorismate mutase n=1 Tax=Ancylobacter tetraedralis TaxID=217068 RepID=A0A839Z667_9HYPH|nr:chorismate mutase [Ancylobacter tetraedralis]MBB3770523.1 chorismate mutase [Ancylobacter tetraedralis]
MNENPRPLATPDDASVLNAGSAPPAPAPDLAVLRSEIDRIDAAMHALLIERGQIIDRLVAVKRARGAEGGSAFRPAREASMMRQLVDRHRGILPLDTVEGIWRVIISTFTYVQAPYAVHADLAAGEAAMRDTSRFHFGFTVPFVAHMGPAGVVAAVAASRGDLGLVPAFAPPGASAWWTALEGAHAPKIIARLPFVERADHPAGLPVFCIAHPVTDGAVTEVETWSLHVGGWSAQAARALAPLADVIAVPDRGLDGAALLVSIPVGGAVALDAVLATLRAAGASVRAVALVGSHARRHTHSPHPALPPGAAPIDARAGNP